MAVLSVARVATPPARRALGLPPLLLALAVADALTGLALSGIGEVLPALHRQWHVSYDQLGLALGLLRLASLVGALWIGPRADRLAPRPLLVGSLGSFAVAWALLPLAGGLLPALPVFALLGVAVGAHTALVTVLAPRLQAEAPAGAAAFLSLAFVLGSAAGPLAGLGSILWTGNASGFALAIAAGSLPLILAYARLHTPTRPFGTSDHRQPEHSAAPDRGALVREIGLLGGILFLLVGLEVSFSTWTFTLLGAPTGMAGTLAASVPLVFWLATAAGVLRLVLGATRGQRPPTFADVPRAGLVGAGAFAVFACSGQVLVALVAAAVIGWALGPVFPLTIVRAMQLRPSAAGRISGIATAANQLGAMVLPGLMGLVVGQGRMVCGIALLLTCLGLTVLAQAALPAWPGMSRAWARVARPRQPQVAMPEGRTA